ncbi:Alpha-1,4-glucan:maltose-1-phosphate maltosyltransferase [bioreactor metagenome]|uniref:Alpha-1,4-glucan:maltose-1-phosphate maltosyltransferase n=1 Tax=bioreactor metagenome TaxID=1076179 RepID=A0A644X2N4_9ZZZZ|nr:alpha-amylase family glycosyl hydrolase [Paludibacter sp.]
MPKFIIYQVLPRLFGNYNTTNKPNGSLEENGCGKFNSFTTKALKEIKSLGVTHVWYTGIIEHATQTDYTAFGIRKDHPAIVKGRAGSAYAIKDYYDVDPDLSENVQDRMGEFERLVERTHGAGLKVIIDFVPNHVARQYGSDAKPEGVIDLGETDLTDYAFHSKNNFYYLPGQSFHPQFDVDGYVEFPAKATGNDQFTAHPGINDWYETVKLNYGVDYMNSRQPYFDPIPDTWHKMLHILLFWAEKKVDGFRCDMAEMVPVEFWHWAIARVKSSYPEIIFIAEVYNPQEYRNYIFHGGFDYLYDKVGMYDLLRNITCHQHAATQITHAWQSLSGIEDKMLHFLENHDEQRIASDFFAGNPWKILPALIVSATLTKAPFMLYAGQELGERGMDAEGFSGLDGRTTIFDYWGVATLQQWSNKGNFDGKQLTDDQQHLRKFYRRLLNLSLIEKAISRGVMYDLQYANFHHRTYCPDKQFTYFRKYEGELILIVVNFDESAVAISLNVPVEALDYLQMESNVSYQYVDLLDEAYVGNFNFNAENLIEISIPSLTGRILKLNL